MKSAHDSAQTQEQALNRQTEEVEAETACGKRLCLWESWGPACGRHSPVKLHTTHWESASKFVFTEMLWGASESKMNSSAWLEPPDAGNDYISFQLTLSSLTGYV